MLVMKRTTPTTPMRRARTLKGLMKVSYSLIRADIYMKDIN